MQGFEGYDLYTAGPGDLGGDLGGGLGQRGVGTGQTTRNYIVVDSVDEDLGGTITENKSEIPGMGWFAAGTDSEGNPLAVYESLPR
jgi:predicted enzyme related to lactoylglutathione lyase